VLATAGVVLATLVEPLARWAWTPRVTAARRGLGDRVRERGWSTASPTPHRHAPRLSAHDSADVGNADDGPIPHATLELLERIEKQDGRGPDQPEHVVMSRAASLLDRAEDDGREVLRVEKGTKLKLVRFIGDWGLVMTMRPSGPVFGWARRSDLVAR
jgi:hypothetical protein